MRGANRDNGQVVGRHGRDKLYQVILNIFLFFFFSYSLLVIYFPFILLKRARFIFKKSEILDIKKIQTLSCTILQTRLA